METRSLRIFKEGQKIKELFSINGAIRSITIISAYVDIESIDQLIRLIRKEKDGRVRPSLKIFIDKSSSRFGSDREINGELIRVNKEILDFCENDSGIYLVQIGGLFHSKAFLIEGNRNSKIIFGSMNFTQAGIDGNEEIILVDDINVNGKMAKWLKKYVVKLEERSAKVDCNFSGKFPSSIRQLLLDGSIYYELKEQNPFMFKLHLPEEISAQQANIDSMLEANVADSISLKSFMLYEKPNGLGLGLPEVGDSKSRWKKYCIETCYGYWCPSCFVDELETAIDKRKQKRRPHFDEMKNILRTNEAGLRSCFMELGARINSYFEKNEAIFWKYSDKEKAEIAWSNWIELLKEKVNNEKLFGRIISGISSVPTPDVWSDPLSSAEFEKTFFESLLYHWSKEYSRDTSNVVASAISFELNIDSDKKESLDVRSLSKMVEKWLIDNADKNIFGNDH